MNKRCLEILESSKKYGWVLEPESKEIMRLCGLATTRFAWLRSPADVEQARGDISFPAIVKVVSPEIMHKSESGGIVTSIMSDDEVAKAFSDLSGLKGFAGIIVEEMASGAEVIIGGKKDPQFGKVVMIGIGGTSVEIYRDVAMRLAPVSHRESMAAIESLRGIELLRGHRGRPRVDLEALAVFFSLFSRSFVGLGDGVESIDLNPVICNGDRMIIADARIIL